MVTHTDNDRPGMRSRSNISLQLIIDQQSAQISVSLVDQRSHQIVDSISGDQLNDLVYDYCMRRKRQAADESFIR